MPSQHLLRCECGKTLTVDARKAGESVRCECGRGVEVPTLLELRRLPTVETEPRHAAAPLAWGWPQALILVSAVVLVGAAPASIYLWATQPRLLRADEIRRRVEQSSPVEAHRGFQQLARTGLHAGYGPEEVHWSATVQRHRLWLGVASAVAVAGLAGLVVGVAARHGRGSTPSHPRSNSS